MKIVRSTATFVAFTLLAINGLAQSPNFVVILTDDQGYADVGVNGATGFKTPNLDRIAKEGLQLKSFYMPIAVCTPSRAGLLTGCHPNRLGLGHRVLFPFSTTGLNTNEVTIAELLAPKGYRSICIGKWHLGHQDLFLPLSQGFDEYFGVPYSNDMDAHYYKNIDYQSPPLPLYKNKELIEEGPDQSLLTKRFTDEAVRFIHENKEQPFFIYLAHCMPHLPIHASKEFSGKSEEGKYGDVIQEIDHGVGRIYDALVECGIDKNTMLVFTSDNGPWHEGSAGPLRGRKNTTWEGGHRVPCLIRYPDRIPAGSVSNDIVTALDLFPTIAELSGSEMPSVKIDGVDVSSHLIKPGENKSPRNTFYYYKNNNLHAVREGKWKLHVHRPEWKPGEGPHEPLLFDLEADIGETNNVAADNPVVVAKLFKLAAQARRELGDKRLDRVGNDIREVGSVED